MYKKFLALRNNIYTSSVTIGIATINSSSYIYDSLLRVKEEIDFMPSGIKRELVICINGSEDNNQTVNEVTRFKTDYPELSLKIINEPLPGKNKAINHITTYAQKTSRSDIIHFLDDDVKCQKGSLWADVKALIDHRNVSDAPLLVGADFKGIKYPLNHFLKTTSNPFKAFRNWYWYSVFLAPFHPKAEMTPYCSGQFLGTFTDLMPSIPEGLQIADDAYMNNYFALLGKNVFEAAPQRYKPVIKPAGSFVEFNLPVSLSEWKGQQERTYSYVENAYTQFETEKPFLRKFFSSPSSFHPDQLRPTRVGGFLRVYFWERYKVHRNRMIKKTNVKMQDNVKIGWNTAGSTKQF